ncbi:hypothetical protein E4U56_000008 [Claviceps arundinis]|uniref:Adhesin domain-containing protein n=1 Tax=Claviceps arundinis TaxID=1623583 RepID=A0A9P7ST65_9HYPO|nr:hypothetical protein E4U56_000008 [Claviceps arundinis]
MGDEFGVGLQPYLQIPSPLRSTTTRHILHFIFNKGYSLSIEQMIERNGHQKGREVEVSGCIEVRSLGESNIPSFWGNSLQPGRIQVEIASENEELTATTRLERTDKQVITIKTPFALDWWNQEGRAPHVTINITVFAPFRGCIDDLILKVISLDVLLDASLNIYSVDTTVITTASGNVHVPLPRREIDQQSPPSILKSRRIFIDTISGNIMGWLPLHHMLRLQSASGNISVELDLESTYWNSAVHANLSVETISGNIDIRTRYTFYAQIGSRIAKKEPPARDYVVELTSVSGSIEAQVVMASRGIFRSEAGDLRLELLPFLLGSRDDGVSHLETSTTRGRTTVFMLEPLYGNAPVADDAASIMACFELANTIRSPSSNLAGLRSSHRSTSGSIMVSYPQSWIGKFSAETWGKLSITGPSVTITRSNTGGPTAVEGLNGEGTSFIRMHNNSGDLALHVGEP